MMFSCPNTGKQYDYAVMRCSGYCTPCNSTPLVVKKDTLPYKYRVALFSRDDTEFEHFYFHKHTEALEVYLGETYKIIRNTQTDSRYYKVVLEVSDFKIPSNTKGITINKDTIGEWLLLFETVADITVHVTGGVML